MIIYKSIPIRIRKKMYFVTKIGGKPRFGFCNDWGDVPVHRYNPITKKFEYVVNLRGWGYANRNDCKFHKKLDKLIRL